MRWAGIPVPDTFLAAAQAIGVPPQDCLVIEDAVTGVKAAGRAAAGGGRPGGQPGEPGGGVLGGDFM
jgi:mannitol-1-/sugar-/sorbitol-6-phosphatase